MSPAALVEAGTMITYVTTSRLTMAVILTDLAAYWSRRYTGTHAGEVAQELVQKAARRGTAHAERCGMRLWKARRKHDRERHHEMAVVA